MIILFHLHLVDEAMLEQNVNRHYHWIREITLCTLSRQLSLQLFNIKRKKCLNDMDQVLLLRSSTWRVFRVVLILQSYLYQVRMPLILCYILRICSGENLVLQGSLFLEPTWGQSFAILFIFATLLLPTEICICIKNINKHNLLSIKFPIKKSFIHFSWLWVINKIFT